RSILFKREADSTITASLINYKWRDGKLKRLSSNGPIESESLIIQLRDANQNLIKEVVELNPLYRSIELFQAGGTIARQEVAIEEAYLTLRVEATINVKYLNVITKYGGYQFLFELL
ncbi:MAG: hypothetical protein AAFO69_15730, partial [Bacteroidota bacterium]